MVKVYLRKCPNYDDSEKILRDLLEKFENRFKPEEKVLVKPNMLSPHPPQDGVTTHPRIVETVLKFLLDLGVKPFVGDSPAVGNAKSVGKTSGILDVCEKLGVPIEDLGDPIEVSGRTYRKIKVSRKVLEADKVVNLPKLKTHSQMVFTLGVKNTFGCVVGREKASWHLRAGTNDNFANLLIDVHLIVNPTLTILDGVIGMEGNGPSNGKVKEFNLLAVSENAFALDWVVVNQLGVPPNIVYTLKEAGKRKLIPEFEVDGEWSSTIELPNTVDVIPIPKILQKMVRQFVRVPRINKNRCVSCRICENECPTNAINIDKKKVDYSKCIRCYICQEVCPENAIDLVRKIL